MRSFKEIYENIDEFTKLIIVSKFKMHSKKRNENLIDGIVYQDVELDFYSIPREKSFDLYDKKIYKNLVLNIETRLNKDGTKPKQSEKVWGVLNHDKEWLLIKASYKEALAFAKETMREIIIKNNIIK